MAEHNKDVLLVDALREKYCPAEKDVVLINDSAANDEIREFARSSRPGKFNCAARSMMFTP